MNGARLTFALGVLLSTAALAEWGLPSPADDDGGVRARAVPLVIGSWRGTEERVPARTLAVLRSDDVVVRRYRRGAEEAVLAIAASSGERRVAHPPEVCLRAAGYEIAAREVVAIPGLSGGGIRLTARRGDEREQVLYWYLVGGRTTSSYLGHQFDAAVGRLAGRPSGAALVRISSGRTDAAGFESLRRFAAEAAPAIQAAFSGVEIARHRSAN